MTFSIIAISPDEEKLGFALATSTGAVGGHAPRAIVPGHGLVAVQAHSDFRRMTVASRLMEFGHTPRKILKDLSEGDEYFEYRQFAILDLYGQSAVYTGKQAPQWAGEIVGENYIATGNSLSGPQVVSKMSEAFESSVGEDLEERLLRAIEAGRDAGGEPDGQVSAAMIVYGRYEFPLVNLRADIHSEPVGELRRVFDWYRPLIPYHTHRTLDPGSVPPLHDALTAAGRTWPAQTV
ncbi:DUF1028 domain-containing protein [Streptomyces sp. NPDC060065]|uniref:DUF1028 domain-containing protein n=1 Tax=Streptomyces sp. NPDC060065 TaxID=3347050 RepID=UPI003673735F